MSGRWARRFAMVALMATALTGGSAFGVVRTYLQPPGDAELVDTLVRIENRVGGIPLLPDTTLSANRTWGQVSGDFVGAKVVLSDVDNELQALVARASASNSPTADAVETVASSYRTLLQGYTQLAAYEQAGLAVGRPPSPLAEGPVSTPQLAVAGDEPRGQAETGLSLLMEALAGFNRGYAVLRDSPVVGANRSRFQDRFNQVQQTARAEGADTRGVISYPSTHLLVAVTRFKPRTPGENPALVVRFACVDRQRYLEARSKGVVEDLPVPKGNEPELPIADCPRPDNDNSVRVRPPGEPA